MSLRRLANIVFATVTLFVVALTIVVFSTALSATCDEAYEVAFYLLFAFELLLYGLTMWCGILILRQMVVALRQQLSLMKPTESFEDSTVLGTSDRYFVERRRQITLILTTYSLTILLRLIWILLNEIYSDDLSCTLVEQVYIVDSDTILGNFIIVINFVIDLLPHVLLPIAMYVIPAHRISLKPSGEVVFTDDYQNMDKEEEEHDDGRTVRKKLSLLMDSTSSQSSH